MKITNTISVMLFISLFISCQNEAQVSNSNPGPGKNNEEVQYVVRGGDPCYMQTNGNSSASAMEGKQVSQPQRKRTSLEMKPIVDSKTGRISCYFPLPTDWRQNSPNSGLPIFVSPNGIKVSSSPAKTYYYNIDPQMAQMAGMAVSNPVPLDAIFRNNLAPSIQQMGGKLIKQYPLNEIARRNHQLLQQVLTRSRINHVDVMASEWEQSNGAKSLVILSVMDMTSQGTGAWTMSITEVEAPAAQFEEAKETYLFAMKNWQVDQQTAVANNAELNRMERESQERINRSWAKHNNKMASDNAAFQATQKAHVSASNAALDGGMASFHNRSASSDRLRNSEINMIHEENTMVNPWDNSRDMQIQSGFDIYYMNSQGDIIGSNNPNFNPNIDQNYNDTEWRTMPKKDF